MQNKDLETHIYDLIVDLCAVLYDRGFRSVSMGAMLRLIGVGDSEAAQHDGEVFELDNDFERILEQRESLENEENLTRPSDVTLH